jgi:ferrous iron transport protein A
MRRVGNAAEGVIRCLPALNEGERAILCVLQCEGTLYNRLRSLGWRSGVLVECVRRSPFGDPVAYRVCGVTVALRNRDAKQIRIQSSADAKEKTGV